MMAATLHGVEPAAHFLSAGAWKEGTRYGLMGLPLAFAALPLYVVWPKHYAEQLAVPLTALGLLLLGARLLDAVADPWIGRLCDRWFQHSHRRVLGAAALAACGLVLGMTGLFFPPLDWLSHSTGAALAWGAALLTLTYLAYSVIGVAHQSWGARLGGTETQRARVVAWREGFALAGVLCAALLPSLVGLEATVAVLALGLVVALVGWRRAVTPAPGASGWAQGSSWAPLREPRFRALLAVFMLNGIASAVPATLLLFFVQDRLQAAGQEALFLGLTFLSAAASLPLWLRLVPTLGLARTWLLGMALGVLAFVWAALLGPGDIGPFALICVASGLAMGTDLALPGALLAGLIGELGQRGRQEGSYFGWWNFATKLNLALAAGLALPLLGNLGYAPGSRDAPALQTLAWAYALLPCALKLLAGAALYRLILRKAAP